MLLRIMTLGVFLVPSSSWAEKYICPMSINVTQTQVEIPSEWRAYNPDSTIKPKDGRHAFTAAWIAHTNHPDSVGSDDESDVKNSRETYTMYLMQDETYVLSCAYEKTHVVLFRSLPAQVKMCSTTFYLKNKKRVANKTVCQ